MLKIKINGAETNLIARERDEGEWFLRCVDSMAGGFCFVSNDVLELWWEEAGEWLPTSESDLVELAVAEAEYAS